MSLKFKSHSIHPPRIKSSSTICAAVPENHSRKEKRLQITEVPRSCAPKTSEYAYFKKFKKDLGGINSQLQKSDDLKTSHANGQESESFVHAKRFEDLGRNTRALFPAEMPATADQSLFLSPPRIDVDKYNAGNRKGECHEIKHGSLCLFGNPSNGSQDVFSAPFASAGTKVSGNQSVDDGIFSTKRKKLRQFVAESFKDVEGQNVDSKGFDLISALLNRLLPQDDETKHAKSKEGIIGADDHPSAFLEPDTLEKSCMLFASTPPHSGSLWNDVLPAHWSGRPQHRVLSEWDMIASDHCQTIYDFETNLQCNEGNGFHGFDNENPVKMLSADNGQSFTQSFEKSYSNGLRVREVDNFHDLDDHPPAFPEPDTLEKSCTLFASTPPHSGSLWNDDLPAHWSGRPQHRVLSEWDMIASDLCQTKFDFKTNLQCNEGNGFHGFNNENTVKMLCADSGQSFTRSFEKSYSNGLRVRELDDFHDLDEPSRDNPNNLLLSLNDPEDNLLLSLNDPEDNLLLSLNDQEDNRLLSLDDPEDIENSHTMLRSIGYHQTVHDTLDAVFLPQLSLRSGRSLDFHSYPDFCSTDAYMHDPWKSHEDDYAMQVAKQFSQSSRYLTVGEDFDTSNHLNYSITGFSRVDRTQCTSLISDTEDDIDTHVFPRGLNIDLGWECLPVVDIFSNYSSNHRIFQLPWKEDLMSLYLPSSYRPDRSSATFDSFDDKVMGNSLLLDYPCRVKL